MTKRTSETQAILTALGPPFKKMKLYPNACPSCGRRWKSIRASNGISFLLESRSRTDTSWNPYVLRWQLYGMNDVTADWWRVGARIGGTAEALCRVKLRPNPREVHARIVRVVPVYEE